MYLWLCLSISAASLYSILLHGYPANEKGNIFKLNLFASLSWIVLLFIFNKCTVTLNKEILLWGVGYGIVQALFVLFKAKAMNAGSVSVTTLVGNASLLVSIVFSCIVWGEKISIADVFGLFLLFWESFYLHIQRATPTQASVGNTMPWFSFCLRRRLELFSRDLESRRFQTTQEICFWYRQRL